MSDFGEAHVGAIIIQCDSDFGTIFFKFLLFIARQRI